MSDVDQVIADAIRLSERLGLIQPDSIAHNIVSALKMEGYVIKWSPTERDDSILAARAIVAGAKAAGMPVTEEELSTAALKTRWEES